MAGGWVNEFPGQIISALKSSGDLSSYQHSLVRWGTAVGSCALVTSSTQKPIGVLVNAPSSSGSGCSVGIGGVLKVRKDSTGASVTRGAMLAATTGGGCRATTGSGTDFLIGFAMSSCGTSTGFVGVLFSPMGYGSTEV